MLGQPRLDGVAVGILLINIFLTQVLIQAPPSAVDDQVTDLQAGCGSSVEQRRSWVVSYILAGLHVRIQRLRPGNVRFVQYLHACSASWSLRKLLLCLTSDP